MTGDSATAFWNVYQLTRALSLTAALPDEEGLRTNFKLAFGRATGLRGSDLEAKAQRYLLRLRQAAAHETMTYKPDTGLALGLATYSEVRPGNGLGALDGCVILALHSSDCYSPAFWLGRAAHHHLLRHVAVLARSDGRDQRFSDDWYRALAESGVFCRECFTMVDVAGLAPGTAVGKLESLLSAGATVLIYVDGTVLPPGSRGIKCQIGRLPVTFPGGVVKLLQGSHKPVATASVHEHDQAVAIQFTHPERHEADLEAGITATVQALLDRTLSADPTSWQPWHRLGACLGPESGGA